MSEAGQFDDAPGDTSAPAVPDTRAPGTAFIDDAPPPALADEAHLLEWSDDEDEDEESEGPDEADFDEPRVEDEDWEMAERGPRAPYHRPPPLIGPEILQSSTTDSGSTSQYAQAVILKGRARARREIARLRRRCRR
jgi:hypothetical protein